MTALSPSRAVWMKIIVRGVITFPHGGTRKHWVWKGESLMTPFSDFSTSLIYCSKTKKLAQKAMSSGLHSFSSGRKIDL